MWTITVREYGSGRPFITCDKFVEWSAGDIIRLQFLFQGFAGEGDVCQRAFLFKGLVICLLFVGFCTGVFDSTTELSWNRRKVSAAPLRSGGIKMSLFFDSVLILSKRLLL